MVKNRVKIILNRQKNILQIKLPNDTIINNEIKLI